MGLKTLPTKKTYPATMDFFLMLGLFLKCYEEGGRRKEELEEDQQETERRMVVQ